MEASSSKGTRDGKVNSNTFHQELTTQQQEEEDAAWWWWWSDLHALRRLLFAFLIAFQLQGDNNIPAAMMRPSPAGKSSEQHPRVMASATERCQEEPSKWTSWCDNCMKQHHQLIISNGTSSFKQRDRRRREAGDADADAEDDKLRLLFVDKAGTARQRGTTAVSPGNAAEHKSSSRPSPALQRRNQALKRLQKPDEKRSARSANSKAPPTATPEHRALPLRRRPSDRRRQDGGGKRSPPRSQSPGRMSNGSSRPTTRQKGSRRVADQLGASDVGSARRQLPPTREGGPGAPPRSTADVMPRPPPKQRPQKEAMEAAATLRDQTTSGESGRAARRDGSTELASKSSFKNTTAGSSSSRRPSQSEPEKAQRAASPSLGHVREAAAAKRRVTNSALRPRPRQREILLPRVQSWSTSSSSSSSSSSSRCCHTSTESSDAAQRQSSRGRCSASARLTEKSTMTRRPTKRATGTATVISEDRSSSSDRCNAANRRAPIRRHPAMTDRSESLGHRHRSMSRQRLPSQRHPLREPSQRRDKAPTRKTGAASSSRLARTDEQEPDELLVVRGHGRLRRLKNKFAIVLHHHHHHHLHDGRAGGDEADSQRRRRRHERSAWEFLKSLVVHHDQHKHGGHLHALVRGLIRHLWGGAARGRKATARSSSPSASRAVAKRAAGKKKVHWWRRLRRHGGLKLAKARKRTHPKLRI